MSILDRFRKKKEEEPIFESSETKLPEDLETFRTAASFEKPIHLLERNEASETIKNEKMTSYDKTELILQKLDTIDARLRFIEEKLKRF